MSAGELGHLRPDDDLGKLAPKMQERVEAALAECHAQTLDAKVFEALRSQELQSVYYARGRTVFPPEHPVTYADDVLHSWHGYGLAVDVISQSKGWDRSPAWFTAVAETFKRHGVDWGGDWTERKRDLPHFQFGGLRDSPSARAIALFSTGGVTAVWRDVGAL